MVSVVPRNQDIFIENLDVGLALFRLKESDHDESLHFNFIWCNALFDTLLDTTSRADCIKLKLFLDFREQEAQEQRDWSLNDMMSMVHAQFQKDGTSMKVAVLRKIFELVPLHNFSSTTQPEGSASSHFTQINTHRFREGVS